MVTPDELTGQMVREFRTERKLTSPQFYAMCGFAGKSTARLMNIEKNDSWKPGDREKVADAMNRLLNGEEPPTVGYSDLNKNKSDNTPKKTTKTSKSAANGSGDLYLFDLFDVDAQEDLEEASFADVAPSDVVHVENEEAFEQLLRPERIELPVITNGQLQTAKRCRRKWWLAWYRKLALREKEYIGARSTGTRVHRALQAWYVPEGHERVDPRDALERALQEDWTAVVTTARERGHDEYVIENITHEFSKTASLERAMVEGYVEWLQETGADAELEVIAPETVVSTDVEVPRADGDTSMVTLKGLLDVRARRTTDGARLFIDHKTVGDLKTPLKTIHMNEQMLHYHLIEWLALDGSEARCDGALYNMLRKVKRTAAANPPFYDRVEVRHNDYELESYKRQMLATTDLILEMTERLDAGDDPADVVYPTRTPNCSWDCDFFAICPMFDDGSRVEDAISSLYEEVNPFDRYEVKE